MKRVSVKFMMRFAKLRRLTPVIVSLLEKENLPRIVDFAVSRVHSENSSGENSD